MRADNILALMITQRPRCRATGGVAVPVHPRFRLNRKVTSACVRWYHLRDFHPSFRNVP